MQDRVYFWVARVDSHGSRNGDASGIWVHTSPTPEHVVVYADIVADLASTYETTPDQVHLTYLRMFPTK